MKVFYSSEEYIAGKNAAVTIGVFDGVHLGHKTILGRVKECAAANGGESVVVTFHPHPHRVLYPEDDGRRILQTLDEKIEALAAYGINKLLVVPFTREFSRISSDEFIEELLVKTINAKYIIIGYDHRFGKNRTGGLEDLRQAAAFFRFTVEEIPAFQIDDANISSTKIRVALREGNMSIVQKYLGYPYTLTGKVVEGKRLGRTLGFPTANLSIDPEKLVPAVGIYLVRAQTQNPKGVYPALLSIGYNPTVSETEALSVEAYLLNFSGDLYGQSLRVELLEYLRDEIKFDSLDALVEQIKKDVSNAQTYFSGLGMG